MIISIGLIIAIAALFYFLNYRFQFSVCPICAGVSATWLLLTLGAVLGLIPSGAYAPVAGILMGGTVVGISYRGEKRFSWAKSSLRFKLPVTAIGFVLVYWAITNVSWLAFSLELAAMAGLAYGFFFSQPGQKSGKKGKAKKGKGVSRAVSWLEKEMENCC